MFAKKFEIIISLVIASLTMSVDHSKFKTCEQSKFCERNRVRNFPDEISSPFVILPDSIIFISESSFTGLIKNTDYPEQPPLSIKFDIHRENVQLTIIETDKERYFPGDVLMDTAFQSVSSDMINHPLKIYKLSSDLEQVQVKWNVNDIHHALYVNIGPSAFRIDFDVNNNRVLSANSLGRLIYEPKREKNPFVQVQETENSQDIDIEQPLDYPYDVDGCWEETFDNKIDTKPYGPTSIGIDISFWNTQHIYGIPEHASTLDLKHTTSTNDDVQGYSEPYRLYNLDVFEFELDSPMSLYGSIPFIMSHSKDSTCGALWLNSAETWVEVSEKIDNPLSRHVHFLSESGTLSLFLLPGPTPSAIFRQNALLTGFPAIQQMFSLAYHQCRWNYKSEDDVGNTNKGFDDNNIPYDVLWLDIEHTDGKKYMTWDKHNFPTPIDMQKKITLHGRKMVTIVDPHIKRDSNYDIHNEAHNNDYYVKSNDGSEFEGWCWPGQVSYIDVIRPEVRDWWAKRFSYDKYQGSTKDLYIWNDMNEPSVFNNPETTMPKDCVHGGNIEHRDVHNIYGMFYHQATYKGLLTRNEGFNDRPFVLSRAFFSGSQRWGAVWTGDVFANWEHLRNTIPMILTLAVSGIPFSGADVGGFFGDPTPELLTRWYQAGSLQPFFRAHAHINSKRREPWLFGEPYTSIIRDSILLRYKLLPYIYTSFYITHTTGMPIMRPCWVDNPHDIDTFSIEDQYIFGSSLLAHPVTSPATSSITLYLPQSSKTIPNTSYYIGKGNYYFDFFTYEKYNNGQSVSFNVQLDTIPLFIRSGSIIPTKMRPRRSSSLMVHDPITLLLALDYDDQDGYTAVGELYLDDGKSYDYQEQKYTYRLFQFSQFSLSSTIHPDADNHHLPDDIRVSIERVIIIGLNPNNIVKSINLIKNNQQTELDFTYNEKSLTIRKPDVNIDEDWEINLIF